MPQRRLRRSEVVGYSIGSFGTGGFGTVPGLLLLFYLTEEGQEGRNAFLEKRAPEFDKFPRFP